MKRTGFGMCSSMAVLLWAAAAAALSPADKCEAGKLLAAGKYGFCRLKAEAKAVKTGTAPDFATCNAKYGDKWGKLEGVAAGACPSTGDKVALQALITQQSGDIATALSGGGLPECPTDLAACLAQPTGRRLQTGQTTCYDGAFGDTVPCAGSGQDGELQKGLTRSYVDNGDGTITDTRTGLMWEKLSDDGSIHDQDNGYTWGNVGPAKIAVLNSSSFAGHSDWRLPNAAELHSLINLGTVLPAVDAPFNSGCVPGCTVTTCSCTPSTLHWTSTTSTNNPSDAWVVDFNIGGLSAEFKITNYAVRAVRDAQ